MQHRRAFTILNVLALVCPHQANAHASEQGFVLLLPTDLYTGAGVVAVVLTVAALLIVPGGWVARLYAPVSLPRIKLRGLARVTSIISGVLLLALIATGLYGPTDPLSNPLVLTVWVVFWLGLLTFQALLGDIWSFLSPVMGLLRLLRVILGPWAFARLPRNIGYWPGILGFFLFAYILLADPKPADPRHLARLVAGYLVFQLGFAFVYGPRWIARGDIFTVVMRTFGRTSIFGKYKLGFPGWKITDFGQVPLETAVLCVLLLGTGSFDGLNETFWWLGTLGMNPLEFSGRSAVVWHNTIGMILANLALLGIFLGTLALGNVLVSKNLPLRQSLCLFAPTLLPIAIGYHVAHYLPSFLVDSQYVMVALSDPFLTGADLLGLGDFYVTTGFFNTQDSVRLIYLTQAFAVVAGHVIAVLVAHSVAIRIYQNRKDAIFSQIPLSAFMVIYTFLGLWLLASPRF